MDFLHCPKCKGYQFIHVIEVLVPTEGPATSDNIEVQDSFPPTFKCADCGELVSVPCP